MPPNVKGYLAEGSTLTVKHISDLYQRLTGKAMSEEGHARIQAVLDGKYRRPPKGWKPGGPSYSSAHKRGPSTSSDAAPPATPPPEDSQD